MQGSLAVHAHHDNLRVILRGNFQDCPVRLAGDDAFVRFAPDASLLWYGRLQACQRVFLEIAKVLADAQVADLIEG